MSSARCRLIAALVVAAALLAGCRAAPSATTTQSADPDAAVLAKLQEAGSNLGKPHRVEFFLYFKEEASARKAADQIRAKSFDVQVEPSAQGDPWLCQATKSMVPKLDELRRIRADFDAVAKSLGGTYDGWGTPVVK